MNIVKEYAGVIFLLSWRHHVLTYLLICRFNQGWI